MKFILLAVVAVQVFSSSCERHEFEGKEGTKQLNEPHESHGGNAAHKGADGHEAEH